MKETQSHSGKDESDSTDNDSNPIEEDEIILILKPKLLYSTTAVTLLTNCCVKTLTYNRQNF